MITLVRASSHSIVLPANSMVRNVTGACLTAWVYIQTAPAAGNASRALSIGNGTVADNSRAAFGIINTRVINMSARTLDGDTGGAINGTVVIPLTTLTHIAVNIDFVNIQALTYINGAYSETLAGDWTSGTCANTQSIASAIGASSNSARFYWDGSIDDARVYNRMLSASELATIHACRGSDGIFYGCQGRWLLNEKQSGYVCLGTESVKNIAEGGVNGTPVAGCVYAESQLQYRRRT